MSPRWLTPDEEEGKEGLRGGKRVTDEGRGRGEMRQGRGRDIAECICHRAMRSPTRHRGYEVRPSSSPPSPPAMAASFPCLSAWRPCPPPPSGRLPQLHLPSAIPAASRPEVLGVWRWSIASADGHRQRMATGGGGVRLAMASKNGYQENEAPIGLAIF
jgi:hypothetical protein